MFKLCFQVYDVNTKKLEFQEPNANSVAWNSECEDMLCYSGNNTLSIKAGNFPPHQQKMMGFVVGFTGSKIFCLHVYSMTTIEVPLSSPLYQYLDKKDLENAYNTGCLGVTESDWKALGKEALDVLDLEVARKSYTRLKDLRSLEFVHELIGKQKQTGGGSDDDQLAQADVLAFHGKYSEAAKIYKKFNQEHRALTMYTDLRMFDLANEYLSSGDSVDRKQLIKKKAEWAAKINEPRAAAEMFLSAGETIQAIEIMGSNGWVDMLIDTGRKLDKADSEPLALVGDYLKNLGSVQYAQEIYRKKGDFKSVVKLYVEAQEWKDAFLLAEKYPEFKEDIYVPYAKFLAESDRFVEAQKAFHLAGRPDEAFRVLQELTINAVNENRFDDASYYYWILAMQDLDMASSSAENPAVNIDKFKDHHRKASIYFAYHTIQRYTDEPFTSYMPEALFNISRHVSFMQNSICRIYNIDLLKSRLWLLIMVSSRIQI